MLRRVENRRGKEQKAPEPRAPDERERGNACPVTTPKRLAEEHHGETREKEDGRIGQPDTDGAGEGGGEHPLPAKATPWF